MAIDPHSVVTDIEIYSSLDGLDLQKWHCIPKNLYLYQSEKEAWLCIALIHRNFITADDKLVIDVSVGGQSPNSSSGHSWESRRGGIWVLRKNLYSGIDQAVTQVNVLFGEDAVDPRPRWALIHSALQLDAESDLAAARISVLRGRVHSSLDTQPALRVDKHGKFKILQISDMHMVTGVGKCNDAIDPNGKDLSPSEADPLTVAFVGQVLDVEKPDLVVFSGDQLHHDNLDSESALLKAVAPVIEREIPWTAIFGNHDDEGTHALSRTAQMSLLQNLPFRHCEPGPDEVDGTGNSFLQIWGSNRSHPPLSTLYFLDSHGQRLSNTQNPDYEAIKQSQIDWFTEISQKLKSDRQKSCDNNYCYLAIVFIHIPLPEFGDPRLVIHCGQRNEPTEGPSLNSHFYDILAKEGVVAVCCGHDHVNDFCALLPRQPQQSNDKTSQAGPWLCYGGCSGFGGYCSYSGKRFYRGMRVLELDEHVKSLKTWRRIEYNTQRVDQLLLINGGTVLADESII